MSSFHPSNIPAGHFSILVTFSSRTLTFLIGLDVICIQISFENQWRLGIFKSNKFGIQELPLVSARNEKGEKLSKGNSEAFLRMGLL